MVTNIGPRPGTRARSDAAKLGRKETILGAAESLLAERRFATLSIADVAERAGLAKGTVYVYFTTKEQVFLALLERRLTDWFDAVDRNVGSLRRPASPRRAARLLVDALDPRLVTLLALLHAVLEENVDEETARAFKTFLRERVQRTAAGLEAALPLRRGGGATLLLRTHALVVGLGQMTQPSPVVRKVLEDPAFALFHLDLARELSASLEAIVTSLTEGKP